MVGGSGLRPRLPGSSRLKTAPTIYYNFMPNVISFFDSTVTERYLAGGSAEPGTDPIMKFLYLSGYTPASCRNCFPTVGMAKNPIP